MKASKCAINLKSSLASRSSFNLQFNIIFITKTKKKQSHRVLSFFFHFFVCSIITISNYANEKFPTESIQQQQQKHAADV